MKLIRIKITKLFELFDYDIPLDNEENLQIITGPNGFGKTMILNIIYSFFNRRFMFFQNLVFEEISLIASNTFTIKIYKKYFKDDDIRIFFYFFEKKKKIGEMGYCNDKLYINNFIEKFEPNLKKNSNNTWTNIKNNQILSIDDIRDVYLDMSWHSLHSAAIDVGEKWTSKIDDILKLFNVHLIKEQRLLKKITYYDNTNSPYHNITDTINEHAKELHSMIDNYIREYSSTSQTLESSYLDRLIDEQNIIKETEYTVRLAKLHQKQEQLSKYDLYEGKQRIRKYSANDAKALLVYLDDTERKLSVFDKLLAQLELFTTILNERRFTFKSIKIHKEKGFIFLTHNEKELKLTDLSSGEQHEVVLLYELIFRADQNTLVLIDEPEISLHVTWQKEFLSDLLRIIALQKIQVIVATHSPQIINGRWDLVYNLEKSLN